MLPFPPPALLSQAPVPTGALSELIRAELAFAAMAREKGTRAAFLANLHPQAILFQPGPVNGRAHWEARSENAGLLTWYPAFAEVSGDGRLGYTSGPAEYRADRNHPEAPPSWRGRFVSLWRKGEDGDWRVVFDGGDERSPAEPALKPDSPARPATPGPLPPGEEARLLEGDRHCLPALGDLAYVIEDRQVFGRGERPGGRAALRVWRKERGTWHLRVILESARP